MKNGRKMMNNESGRMWEEDVEDWFKGSIPASENAGLV
jgi:hypothetical protein